MRLRLNLSYSGIVFELQAVCGVFQTQDIHEHIECLTPGLSREQTGLREAEFLDVRPQSES